MSCAQKYCVSSEEFTEYQEWQAVGGPFPVWFMTNDDKALEIMVKYSELQEHFKRTSRPDHEPGNEVKCCMCTQDGVYEDIQDAYDHGWFQHECCEYCPEHAEQGIVQADHGEIYTILQEIIQSI